MSNEVSLQCPVCGSSQLQPMHRNRLAADPSQPASVLAYRCDNGHIFIAPQEARLPPSASRSKLR